VSREELIERLDDLLHDLGKHLLLPVALLPATATADDLRAAIAAGLRQVAAWHAFQAAGAAALANDTGFRRVQATVAAALVWADAVDVDRAQVQADFAAVGQAVRAWRLQVAGD